MACIWLLFLLHLFLHLILRGWGTSWQISIRRNSRLFYFVSVPCPLAQTKSQKCSVLSLLLGRKMDTYWHEVSVTFVLLPFLRESTSVSISLTGGLPVQLLSWKPDKPGQAQADTPRHGPFRFHSILFCDWSIIYLKCIIGATVPFTSIVSCSVIGT